MRGRGRPHALALVGWDWARSGGGFTIYARLVIGGEGPPIPALSPNRAQASRGRFELPELCLDGWNGCCDAFGMAEAKVYPQGAQTAAAGSFREAPARLHFDRERLGHLCRERGVARLDLFGSALRDDFGADSDVDLLAALRAEACVTLLDWADLQEKLSEVFGRPVDLVSRRAVEGSQNPYRKQAILSTALPIYVEG